MWFLRVFPPTNLHAEIRRCTGRSNNCASHGTQIDAEGDFDLIGFACHIPHFLNDRFGCWQDFVRGILKGLPGLLNFVVTASTDGATCFWFLDLDDDAAPLFQGKFYKACHLSSVPRVFFTQLPMHENRKLLTLYYDNR